MTRGCLAVVGLALITLGFGGRPCGADDKWELGSLGSDDSSSGTYNFLEPGATQTHDLQGAPDQDWIRIIEESGHSYEVRASGGTVPWNDSVFCLECATLARVDDMGTILTGPDGSSASGQVKLRWIYTGLGSVDFILVKGSEFVNYTTNEEYEIRYYDTTYFIPRWNNSASQATILVIQSHKGFGTVTGDINFYNAAGTLLHTQPLNVASHGTQVFNSATIPALQGASGSVAIAHLGGFGALSGKAVALEPATGFTFDTMMMPYAP